MSYTGCVVGVGSTNKCNPVLLYGLSDRTAPGVSKIAVVRGSLVSVEPYGDMTPEQKAETSWLVYNAIMTSASGRMGVVGSGKQTGSVFKDYVRRRDANNTADNNVSRALRRWGHEGKVGDRYNTPRIAGMVDVFMFNAGYMGCSALGIVTAENEKSPTLAADVDLTRGSMAYLSTCTGEGAEPEAPKFQAVSEAVKTRRMEGRTAKELTEEMYDFMGPEFFVSSAAAVWVPSRGGWELAVKNRN
ncbi:MAG: hypothetical protein HYS53_02260 [Candidatus Aenigmarchaeota archaeon]|nr:hypothetical protein [Candidatus Aenigmarchaeota archaeon]